MWNCYLIFQQLKHIDFSFNILVMAFFTGIVNLFVFCYFGKLATESFEEMGNCLFESNWHVLPIALQKANLLMIQNMQKPIYYHGFGMAILNLTTFSKVTLNILRQKSESILMLIIELQYIKTVVTCYMMFKTLTSKWTGKNILWSGKSIDDVRRFVDEPQGVVFFKYLIVLIWSVYSLLLHLNKQTLCALSLYE